MPSNIWNMVDGRKTHILAFLGVLVALVGHFWGPIQAGPIQIPSYAWDDVWKWLYASGLISAGRDALKKLEPKGN